MVRIQARRESELKLSEFMKFSMIWKIKKEAFDDESLYTSRIGKVSGGAKRRRGKFSSIEWKARERKMLCIELRNFLSQANLFLCYFWHLFMTKAFL